MENFLIFLLYASLYLLVFGMGYYLLMRALPRNRFRRVYILLSFTLSLILAYAGSFGIALPVYTENSERFIVLPEFVLGAQTEVHRVGAAITDGVSSFTILSVLFIGVMLFLAFRTFIRVMNILRQVWQNPSERLGEVKLVLMPGSISPFSFFHWIFIPLELRSSGNFDKVLVHEKAHYYYRHSWDVMFLEAMRILFWYHPVWYFFRSEMQALHEFEADNYALAKFPKIDYQRALLDFALGAHYLPATNPFNVSLIKKRFIMMNQSENNISGRWIRLAIILPFVFLVFVVQAFRPDGTNFQLLSLSNATDSEIFDIANPALVIETDSVYTEVDVDPAFQGGQSEMMKFLQSNLRYPDQARADSLQGTVFITFIVEPDGEISDARVLRGVHQSLDEEALRVINIMPPWKPGSNNNQKVRVQFNLPIRFVLN